MNREFEKLDVKNSYQHYLEETIMKQNKKRRKTNDQKRELREKIRTLNSDYIDKVEKAMALITNEDLTDKHKIVIFSKRIAELRLEYGWELEEVGEYFDVNHDMISYLEKTYMNVCKLAKEFEQVEAEIRSKITQEFPFKTNEELERTIKEELYKTKESEKLRMKINKKSIDKYYLELSALLYKVSPLYLIGLNDEIGKYDESKIILNPVLFEEKLVVNKAKTIVRELYRKKKTRHILWTFVKICDARCSWRKYMKDFIAKGHRIEEIANKTYEPKKFSWKRYISSKISYGRTLGRCVARFCDLARISPEMFNLLYNLSFHIDVSEKLCNWLEVSGMLDQPYKYKNRLKINLKEDNNAQILIYDDMLGWI